MLRVAIFHLRIVALGPLVVSAVGEKAGSRRLILAKRGADVGGWSMVFPSPTQTVRITGPNRVLAAGDSAAEPLSGAGF